MAGDVPPVDWPQRWPLGAAVRIGVRAASREPTTFRRVERRRDFPFHAASARHALPAAGLAASNARVEGCSGCSRIKSLSPCSTASPRYITSTPCATKRTTEACRDEEISEAELLLQVEHQVPEPVPGSTRRAREYPLSRPLGLAAGDELRGPARGLTRRHRHSRPRQPWPSSNHS